MRVLLTNHGLDALGGSETWVRTMYVELTVERGFDVDVYVPPGRHQLWPDMTRFNPSGRYDLVLQNHNNTFPRRHPSFGKVVFTSHGIIPPVERPVPWADRQVAVSEEVRDFYQVGATVIRNPIDLVEFRPTRPVNPRPENVLFLSNNQAHALDTVRQACQDLNLEVVGGTNRRHDIARVMNQADVVVTLGRGVYEAMACNRNVVVYDVHGGDGPVTTDTIFDYRTRNCSGRYGQHRWTPSQLRDVIETSYDPDPQLRGYVRDHHDVRLVADQYLAL